MSYVGSGGQTRSQLARAIHLPTDNDQVLNGLSDLCLQLRTAAQNGKADLTLANSIWVDSTYVDFKTNYVKRLEQGFAADPHAVVFRNSGAASDQINSWVSKETRGKIGSVVTPADFQSKSRLGVIDEPSMVSISAVCFKADWGSGFDARETSPRTFHLDTTNTTQATMMHQASRLRMFEDDRLSFLEIPYKSRDYSMWVVLPKGIIPVRELALQSSVETLLKLEKQAVDCNVDLLFPKFEMSSRHTGTESLRELGAVDCFDKTRADFSGMFRPRVEAYRVYLSDVRQDAWIETHEKGTEAAAATTSIHFSIGCSAPPMPHYSAFHADHPFLYFIVHNSTQTILFCGWVANPGILAPNGATETRSSDLK